LVGIGNELFGWRITFILAGLPGLLLAPLVLATIVEPRETTAGRASGEAAAAGEVRRDASGPPAPPCGDVVRSLWRRSPCRRLGLACSLHALALYGAWTFNAAFLIRSHGWGTAGVGALLALIGAFGLAGTFLGGVLADRLCTR